MKNLFKFLLFFSIISFSHAQDSFKLLLGKVEQQNDLSLQTKKESLGHVTVFTRQDIDRMRLFSLKDLLEYLRFLTYNENIYGLPSPYYSQKSNLIDNALKVFIDDQELVFPYQGTGLQFFGQIDLKFIDHVEIYDGTPAFSFGIATGSTIIKLYTKTPNRENSTVLGASVGSYGAFKLNGVAAHEFDDFSYLLSIDKQNLNRKKIKNSYGKSLKRDQESSYLYTKFSVDNFDFVFSALKSEHDTFIGKSLILNPSYGSIDLRHLYFGINYLSDDKTYKAYLGYSNSLTKKEEGGEPLGFLVAQNVPATKLERDLEEHLLDAHLGRKIEFGRHTLNIGYRGRFQKYKLKTDTINNLQNPFPPTYTQELISSFYIEDQYSFDEKNIFMTSLKYSHHLRNGDAKNNSSFAGRVGYIYNEEKWFNKAFIFAGDDPSIYYQFHNYNALKDTQTYKSFFYAFANEFGYHFSKTDVSLLAAYLVADRSSSETDATIKLASFNFVHNFDELNKLIGALWVNDITLNDQAQMNRFMPIGPSGFRLTGGQLSLLNSFNKFELASAIHFVTDNITNNNYFNLNSVITYNHSRNLEFYLKATNILNKSKEGGYFGLDQEFKLTYLNAPLYDRAIWFGVEYLF